MMPSYPIRLQLLGPPKIFDNDGVELSIPIGKPLALLAYLHLQEEPVPRATLAEFFWPDTTPRKARASLRQALWLLRKHLGGELFVSDDPVQLASERITSDLRTLTRNPPRPASPETLEAIWREPPFHYLVLPELPEWQRWTDRVRTEAEQIVASSLFEWAHQTSDLADRMLLLEAAARVQPYRASIRLALIDQIIVEQDFERADIEILRVRDDFSEDPSTLEEADRRAFNLRQLRRRPYEGAADPYTVTLEFVGRTSEYTALVQAWRVARTGKAQRALITGEAGIGKSRLAEQVTTYAAADGARTVRVKAQNGEDTLDWSFLNNVLRQLLKLSGAAGIGRDSDRILRTLLPGLGVDGPGGSAPPDPGPVILGEPTGAAIAEALHDLLAAVTDDAPLVLSLDDLQWADVKSRSVILRTVRRLHREPVLTLLTCRSEGHDAHLDRAVRLLSEGNGLIRVDLSPLSEADVREAVSLLAEFSPESGVGGILNRICLLSRGNPLFLVEVLQTLHERGVIEPDEAGEWVLHVDRFPDDLPLPSSVRGLLDLKLQGLTDDSVRILEVLVAAHRPLPPRVLQERSGLDSATFSASLHALLERGVLSWTRDDTLGFSHDEIQATARDRFARVGTPDPKPESRRSLWWIGSAASVLLVMAAAATLGGPLARGESPAPVGGGGSIFLVYEDQALAVHPDHGHPSEWEVTPVAEPELRESTTEGVHRLPDGKLAWFIRGTTVEDPPWIIMSTGTDSAQTVVRTEGDDFFADAFPDGRSILYSSEDRNSPVYTRYLYRMELETGETTRLLDRFGIRNSASVSPDGRRIAASTADSLFILSPNGTLLRSEPHPVAGTLRWCGSAHELLHLTLDPEGTGLEILNFETDFSRTLATVGLPGPHFACSPDGRFVAYSSITDMGVSHVVLDRETGKTEYLPVPLDRSARIFWRGQEPSAIPERLHLLDEPDEPIVLSWGEILPLAPRLEQSDGSLREVTASFESNQPAVASVADDGRVFANSPGQATIRATWDGWMTAEFAIVVGGDERSGTIVEDRFERIDPDRWQRVGYPTPVPATLDENPVLRLRGDGRYTDGLIQREPQSLTEGGTAEIDFRLRLTRIDRQDVRFCLMESELPPRTDETIEWFDLALRQYVCFRYPGRNLAQFDPEEALWTNHLMGGIPIDVGDHLPSDDWVHLAIQLRADGEITAFLNGEFVGRFPVRLRNDPEVLWRVGIFGHSVDTEVHVRNLALWPGMRHD
ncbi:MAG: hypothetical protein EA351_07920 [Gemmatimonadales bacterium]|nr:MAG: hypothetical protein EA351_07920 [Gemmatimonadales bacterium]